MFKIDGPLLGKQEIDTAKLKHAVKTTQWPEYDTENDFTREEWAKLETEFRYFEGPVRDPDHFALIVILKPGDELCAWIEYQSGSGVSVHLFDDDDIWEGRDLLKIMPAVEQIKAVPRVGPNKPCPCGSNRKFKKCCGR